MCTTFTLIAEGPHRGDRWSQPLSETGRVCVGRAPRDGWSVPWDPQISREHLQIELIRDRLHVHQLPTARNPVLFQSHANADFECAAGEEFFVGATRFRLEKSGESLVRARTIAIADSQGTFANNDRRLAILHSLPEEFAAAANPTDLAQRVLAALTASIPRVHAAAILAESQTSKGSQLIAEVTRKFGLQWSPSRRLCDEAIMQNETRLHIWSDLDDQYTGTLGLGWAFCTPIRGTACQGWVLYAAGKAAATSAVDLDALETSLLPDIAFAELLGRFLGALTDIRRLEQQRTRMAQFFSPAVVQTLSDERADELLRTQSVTVTALFCDLRGFSRAIETDQDLANCLKRVSNALGVVTREIIREEGIIADFQGDSVFGFWGWPIAEELGSLAACRAALNIYRENERQRITGQAGFQMGVGIGTGTALAGRIGTDEQSKVGVFGPVVNRASRLEGLTSAWPGLILIDGETADSILEHVTCLDAGLRELGTFRPAGMNSGVTVWALTPRSADQERLASAYAPALTAFRRGDWEAAAQIWRTWATVDPVCAQLVNIIEQHRGCPPIGWDGAITLRRKRLID